LSPEDIISALESFGLKKDDVQVYVYLARKGPCEEKDLADTMKFTKRKLCAILKRLLAKGMIRISPEFSINYSAMSIEEVLDMFLKEKKQGIEALRISREELILMWRQSTEKLC
jgi:sugar-specific transcriptional regulator TrmB